MRSRAALLFLVAATIVACESPLEPDELAGTYVLYSASPSPTLEVPAGGEIVLTADGSATRRLRYDAEDGNFDEHIWTGRYRVRDGRLELALSGGGESTPESAFRPATYDRGMIVLRFFTPHDGPEVFEVYVRE